MLSIASPYRYAECFLLGVCSFECHYADCLILIAMVFTVILSVNMLSVIILSGVVMLIVAKLTRMKKSF
jgi:hypothetical protein